MTDAPDFMHVSATFYRVYVREMFRSHLIGINVALVMLFNAGCRGRDLDLSK